MRFLPIVERELRVTARRPRTYWVRLLIAFIGIAIGAVMLGAYSLSNQTQATIGKTLFHALSGLAFLYCLFAGRLATADSISGEKRDGTLGLLFLTDLKGYDIVIGKMVATSLNSFYGLLAILPVLGLPLLLGGMTNGEFVRMAVVLVNMFLLSLAIGIGASAMSRDARSAYGGNLLLTLAAVVIVPYLVAQVLAALEGAAVQPEHFVASPAFGLYATDAAVFAAAPKLFWGSLAVAQTWAWLLIGLASWVVPRTWQDLPAAPMQRRRDWRGLWRQFSYGDAAGLKPFRKRLLDVNGYYWLAARARLKPLHVWLLLVGAAFWWLVGWHLNEGGVWLDPATGIALAVILNAAIKMWVAIEAGQQLGEDHRAGTLELLLSTPLTVRDIVRGQLLALRRQFLGPLLVILGVEFTFMLMAWRKEQDSFVLYLWLAGMAMLLADVAALSFVAMAAALTAKTPQQMILKTFFRILILPWLAFAVICVLANLWVSLGTDRGEPLPWQFNLGTWFLLGLAFNLGFGLHGARVLRTRFRELAGARFDAASARPAEPAPMKTGPAVRPESAVAKAPHRRRWAVATAVVIALLAGGGFQVHRELNPRVPGPITIPLSPGDALESVRLFATGSGFFIVLPDQSLWQWGRTTPADPDLPMVPRLVDGSNRWQTVQSSGRVVVGLKTDGTLWSLENNPTGRPVHRPLGGDHDWREIYVGQRHYAALKRDGSLWMWGDNRKRQLGTAAADLQPDPVQVGTSRNWKQIIPFGAATLGLQEDGSLWFWGEVPPLFKTNTGKGEIIPEPVRYCLETNWIALAAHWGALARTATGDWHNLFFDRPDSTASAADNTRIVIKNSQSSALTFGLNIQAGSMFAMYERRTDGTLWHTSYLGPSTAMSYPLMSWQQFGARSDWLEVWGNGNSMLGLTSDGTLWMWGLDPALQPGALKLRVDRLQAKLYQLFNAMPGRGGGFGLPPIQREPRPLIHFVPKE